MTTHQESPNSASVMVVMHEHEKLQLLDLMTREGFHHNPDDLALWIPRLCYLYIDGKIDLGDDYTFFDRHQMAHLIRFILGYRSEIPIKRENFS